MKAQYADWLRRRGHPENTIGTQLYRVSRVEEHYGDLDAQFDRDQCRLLISELNYSTQDTRRNRPNPTKIPFAGDPYKNLASYKGAVVRYARFRADSDGVFEATVVGQPPAAAFTPNPIVTRRPAKAPIGPLPGARTLVDFHLDGRAALEALVAASRYRTIAQAVASLTLFSHPATVGQTEGKALFPSIRDPRRVGQIEEREGRRLLLDDNKSPTDAFLWANGIARRGPDTQFNHLYASSLDAGAYTALPNICMTPAFIAKLTDTNKDIKRLLRFRSFQLYQWFPDGHDAPERPEEYETLEWAAPLPAVEDVRATLERAMASKPKDRTVIAARELGWLFG